MKLNKTVLGVLFLGFLTVSQPALSGEVTCTGSDVSNLSALGDYCYMEPDYYAITVFEMGLCTSAPTAPTNSSTADMSGCQAVFESTAGSLVVVENGATSEPAGTFSRPDPGSYTHAYMRLDNTFLIRGTVDFGAGHPDADFNPNRYCVSNTASTDNETNDAVGTCSNTSGATPGTVTTELINFDGAGGGDAFTATVGSLTAYLLDSSQQLSAATTTADVDGLLGVQSFSSPINITPDTRVLDAAIRVSQGMTVSWYDDAGTDKPAFDSGPFVLELSVE